MEVLEVSAKTVEEAIAKALKQLGVSREEVNITVISEGKSGGIFGIGAEDAMISVEVISSKPVVETSASDITEATRVILEKLLNLMEIEGMIVPGTYFDESGGPNSAPIALNIEGDDLGILIGRRGQTLSSLQYIVRLIVGHQTNTWVPIVIDAEGYKQRRRDALKSLAQRMAEQVKVRGAPFTLEPMPAFERRIIHTTLADHPAVFTESIGEGESRKVVIRPKHPGNAKGFSNNRNNHFNRR